MPMVSLQLPDDLLENFTNAFQRLGFVSRSDALREAINYFIQRSKDIKSYSGIIRTILTVEYEGSVENFEILTAIENTYTDMINGYSEYKFGEKFLRIYSFKFKVSNFKLCNSSNPILSNYF